MSQYSIGYVDSFRGEVTFNGIPYGYIDRTGHLAVWNVSMMFQAARSALSRTGNIFDMRELSTGNLAMFIAKQTILLKRDVHQLIPYTRNVPLTFTLSLQNVRNSSFQYVHKMYHGSTNKYLGESVLTMVVVGKRSRRPVALPAWFKEKYKEYRTDNKPVRETFPAAPVDAFSCQIIPRHSDMDINNHVNQAMYIEYCMNCATDAALFGYYKHYNDDMCLYPVLEMDLSYVGESVAGDKLTLFTWQGEEPDQIYFSLTKSSKPILQCRFLFGQSKSSYPISSKDNSKL